MRGISQVLAAWCLVSTLAEHGKSVIDGIYWCNTLCVCRTGTQMEVQCFQWTQLYDLMVSTESEAGGLERDDWLLEGQAHWCTEVCLCNTNNVSQIKCVQKKALIQLVTDHIGDWYLHGTEEDLLEEDRTLGERILEQEEEREEVRYRKKSEKRRNRKNRKPKKKVREKEGAVIHVENETETEPMTEHALAPSPTIPSLPLNISARQNETEIEETVELLSMQEAASASPTMTTQPSISLQNLTTTAASASTTPESSRESHTTAVKVSPVREVPMERKTVASEVSQDLDELGSAIMQIKSDVILNQRILLVTVAIAGTALLG